MNVKDGNFDGSRLEPQSRLQAQRVGNERRYADIIKENLRSVRRAHAELIEFASNLEALSFHRQAEDREP
jgi:hypothetical protein